jgi:hypothetical protein
MTRWLTSDRAIELACLIAMAGLVFAAPWIAGMGERVI